MAKMRAVQVPESRRDFELVEREIPDPVPDKCVSKVQACGICFSDISPKTVFPGIQYRVFRP